jgi:predicted nucleotidyltransferase
MLAKSVGAELVERWEKKEERRKYFRSFLSVLIQLIIDSIRFLSFQRGEVEDRRADTCFDVLIYYYYY